MTTDHNRLPGPLSLEGNCVKNWKRFIQEFEIYLVGSEKEGKKDEVKVALLLHCGDRELLDIYNTLPMSKEEKKDYEKLKASLNNHFEPKKYTKYERYLFNTRTQQPDWDHELHNTLRITLLLKKEERRSPSP
ncbi:hypothetical protein Pcinc_015934 [Petrolisthes cinctipes]|uniref:Uncharacterized protein n=1 Tax=Petrolisthes cinctipes TaxID=88211 RepID=A0AAE1KRL2_PETCI|nr:hypothetical protein Pcinc_015934 [Petrolisthes cinctipes]